jgi:hypothetical protein
MMDIGDYPCFMRNALSDSTIRAQLRHRDALAYARARPHRAAEDSQRTTDMVQLIRANIARQSCSKTVGRCRSGTPTAQQAPGLLGPLP